ncbi:MAG: ABC transporter ATP-binding protein [Burkholderiaceae bacterium]|nr:MAG: ABC transporter ATP-binding protein [Burkholderiaceae bacterium]
MPVEIQGLKFGYGDRLILDGLNMRFPRGKLIALMGGSGSGKTTILRLIGGQQRTRIGTVKVFGEDVARQNSAGMYHLRRRMGMLFQFGALFTDMSVFDNVAFPLREHTNLSSEQIRDLVLMKLHAVGLRGAADLMPAQISGGMSRRVALARAIALDPQLIMYDEPFAGLDPISLGITANLVRRLNDALGATSILVTHDIHESFDVCDYCYILAEGRIAAEGTPEELRHSDDPFVQQFVYGRPQGPVAFHYPSKPYADDLNLNGAPGSEPAR